MFWFTYMNTHDCVLVCVWCMYTCVFVYLPRFSADLANLHWITLNYIDKITGLFCKEDLWKRQYSAKETYHFIDPPARSHPIPCFGLHIWIFCKRDLFSADLACLLGSLLQSCVCLLCVCVSSCVCAYLVACVCIWLCVRIASGVCALLVLYLLCVCLSSRVCAYLVLRVLIFVVCVLILLLVCIFCCVCDYRLFVRQPLWIVCVHTYVVCVLFVEMKNTGVLLSDI